MRIASLGSGSGGNATLIEAAESRVLLDCGFGPRVIARRLHALGVEPETLDAIAITHEHDDHLRGLVRFADRHGLPVYATHGTFRALEQRPLRAEPFDAHRPLRLAGLVLEPFPVVHDATEPCQFVIGDGRRRLGVLTDTGQGTPHMTTMLRACDAILLECNHDPAMLRAGPYPRWLQERIAGRFGHLANAQAAELLSMLDRSRLQHVLAGHLSERNNAPEAVRAAIEPVLAGYDACLEVLQPDGDSGWWEIA